MAERERFSRSAHPLMLLLGGVSGGLGVALSAMASHASAGDLLDPAARMLLAHAPLFLFLALIIGRESRRIFSVTALVLSAGLLLFCGDLVFRAWIGTRLFPFAAPLGGALLIGAWVCLAIEGVSRLAGKAH